MEKLAPIICGFLEACIAISNWTAVHQHSILLAAYALAGISVATIFLRVAQGKLLCRRSKLYQVAVPQGTDIKPFAAEQMFSTLYGLQESAGRRFLHGLDHIGLEIAADHSGIRFYLWVPKRIADSAIRLIHSAYEQADIRPLAQDYLNGPGTDAMGLPHRFACVRRRRSSLVGARMALRHDIAFPIKTLREFEKTDPLAAVTAAMGGLEEGEGVAVQLLIQPGGAWELGRRTRAGIREIERRRRRAQPTMDGRPIQVIREATPEEEQQFKAIGGKQAKLPFRVSLRLLAMSPHRQRAYAQLRGLAAAYEQFHVAILNGWRRRDVWFARRGLFLRHFCHRSFPLWGRRKAHCPLTGEHDILTIEELSSLWHLPHPAVVETPGIIWSLARKRASSPTAEIAPADGLVIARTVYQGERRNVVLPTRALFTHVAIIGLPGSGKTTMLAQMAQECIERGIAVILLDPHGDLCDKLLPRIPERHRDRVVYFNPAGDFDRPMGLNFIEAEPGQHPAQVKSEVLTMLAHLFGEQLIGPRSALILSNCIQTLQDLGGMTILEVNRLLTDETFRQRAVLHISNPEVQQFWHNFYEPLVKKNPRLHLETISPVLNKIGAFATDSRLAHVVGQTCSAFSMRDVMDNGKALICNLTQGGLGLDNSRLLGGAIASRVMQAAMARERVPEAERRPAVLIADEFHIYVGPAFPQALAQVRKYRLGLVLACQLISQLDDLQGMRSAFLSAGTLCVFKLAAEDGVRVATELTNFFDPEDLVRMDPYQVAIRMALGHERIPFSGETIPLEESAHYDPAGAEVIQEACRERYGRSVEEIRQEIQGRSRLPRTMGKETTGASGESSAGDVAEKMEVYNVPEI